MATKCECPDCMNRFAVNNAFRNESGWNVCCPVCGCIFDIDIEDFALPEGTLVQLKDGTQGRILRYYDDCTKFEDIRYDVQIDRNLGRELRCLNRSQFSIIGDWRLLRRTRYGIERVCHYPQNQEYGNVPCYNCADRTKCNADIFERLCRYEEIYGPLPEDR